MSDLLKIAPLIKVYPDVLSVLVCHKIDANDAVAHFVEIFDKVRTLPANYRYRKTKRDNVWIIRDNFPGTNVFYKMTVVLKPEDELIKQFGMVKGERPDGLFLVNVKLIPPKHKYRIAVDYEQVQKYLLAKSNNIILGDDIKPEPIIKFEVKVPRRMYPKGFKEV